MLVLLLGKISLTERGLDVNYAYALDNHKNSELRTFAVGSSYLL